jgi:uncharacterized repeat protein (TIGR02543 family)
MEFPSGTEISLIATPADGWRFERWYDINTRAPYLPDLSIRPDQDMTFSALFLPKTYNLNLISTSNGYVKGGGQYDYGSEVEINAIPFDGYEFAGWEGGGAFIDNSNSQDAVVTVPDQNITLNASFTPSKLKVEAFSNGSGQISGEGSYDYRELISLLATPSAGSIFDKWEFTDVNGNQVFSSQNPLEFHLLDNLFVTAYFASTPENYTDYQLLSTPPYGGVVYDDSLLRFWDSDSGIWERSLLAKSHPGYSFLGWTNSTDTSFSPKISSRTTSRPATGATITANFATNSYSLKVQYENSDGNVSGQGENFSYGDTAHLVATPSLFKDFSHWDVVNANEFSITLG